MLESGIATAARLAKVQSAQEKGVSALDKGQSALARLLGCTPQCVQRWVEQGFATPKRCKDIVKVLDGRVTLAQLNPAIFGDLKLA